MLRQRATSNVTQNVVAFWGFDRSVLRAAVARAKSSAPALAFRALSSLRQLRALRARGALAGLLLRPHGRTVSRAGQHYVATRSEGAPAGLQGLDRPSRRQVSRDNRLAERCERASTWCAQASVPNLLLNFRESSSRSFL